MKRDDLTLGECREYWASRRTDGEMDAIAGTIRRARLGLNARPENLAERAVDFSMRHRFETHSALPIEELATTAMEQAMGGARLEDIERELKRQGVITCVKDGQKLATTASLMREEEGLAAFAANGLGSVDAVGVSDKLDRRLADGRLLNQGQWDAVCGLLRSNNRVNSIEGPAGAGKSSLLAKLDEGMKLGGQNMTYLATTAPAVKVLRKDGFDATTVAHFLLDTRLQDAARGGRVVVDETSMLGHKDAVELCRLARANDLKLIFAGDPMQHGSIGRGAFMRLLREYGEIRPFRLDKIMRQDNPQYREAAQLLSEGKTLAGFDALDQLQWVREMGNPRSVTGRWRRITCMPLRAAWPGTMSW